jgi:hypothetical protein
VNFIFTLTLHLPLNLTMQAEGFPSELAVVTGRLKVHSVCFYGGGFHSKMKSNNYSNVNWFLDCKRCDYGSGVYEFGPKLILVTRINP